MNKIRYLSLISILALFTCGSEEEEDRFSEFHFPNADFYSIYSRDPNNIGMGGIRGLPRKAACSPDGNSIVFTELDDLWSIPPTGGMPVQITDLSGWEGLASWHPLGETNKLAFVNETDQGNYISTIYTISPGEEPERIRGFKENVHSLSWSQDGERIFFLRPGFFAWQRGIYWIPAEGGDETKIPNNQEWTKQVFHAQASPTRDVIIYLDGDRGFSTSYKLKTIDINGGEPTTIFTFPPQLVYWYISFAESYDGSVIACTACYPTKDNGNLFLIPSGGGEPTLLSEFSGEIRRLIGPSWFPDGQSMVISGGSNLYLVELKL